MSLSKRVIGNNLAKIPNNQAPVTSFWNKQTVDWLSDNRWKELHRHGMHGQHLYAFFKKYDRCHYYRDWPAHHQVLETMNTHKKREWMRLSMMMTMCTLFIIASNGQHPPRHCHQHTISRQHCVVIARWVHTQDLKGQFDGESMQKQNVRLWDIRHLRDRFASDLSNRRGVALQTELSWKLQLRAASASISKTVGHHLPDSEGSVPLWTKHNIISSDLYFFECLLHHNAKMDF